MEGNRGPTLIIQAFFSLIIQVSDSLGPLQAARRMCFGLGFRVYKFGFF